MSFCMMLFVTPAIIPSYPCSSQALRFLLVFSTFFYGLPQEMMMIMTAGQVQILLLIRWFIFSATYRWSYSLSSVSEHPPSCKDLLNLQFPACSILYVDETWTHGQWPIQSEATPIKLSQCILLSHPFSIPPPSFWYLTIGYPVFVFFFSHF